MGKVLHFRKRRRAASLHLSFWAVLAAFATGAFGAIEGWERGANVPQAGVAEVARAMPICRSSVRHTCVVDGDTIWLDGEKIRLSTFNTAEMDGACRYEVTLARTAQNRLSQLLSENSFTVTRQGHDRYGRTLAVVAIKGQDVGDILINERLAHRWHGRREQWC